MFCPFLIRLLFFFSLLSFEDTLYIMETSLLLNTHFVNSFFCCIACLFLLLAVYFMEQTFLIWKKIEFITSFMDYTFGAARTSWGELTFE